MDHDPDLSPALRTLPPTLFGEAVARLTGGQTVRRVARWLMSQDRGALQHQGRYEIRKQVAQLKGCVDRNEQVFIDVPPQPQGQETSQALSPYEVPLEKLQQMARADRLTGGREVLNFVLCTELERLRELQQTGGPPGQRSTVLKHIRQIGETLCKLGPGVNAYCEDYPPLGPDGNPVDYSQPGKSPEPINPALIAQVRAMDPADRMLGLSIFRTADELLRLQGEMEREGGQEAPPESAEDKPEP